MGHLGRGRLSGSLAERYDAHQRRRSRSNRWTVEAKGMKTAAWLYHSGLLRRILLASSLLVALISRRRVE